MERRLNAKERKTLESIFKLPQESIMSMMYSFLIKRYGEDNVIRQKAFIIARGEIPVGLVAHADTVHSKPPKEIPKPCTSNIAIIIYLLSLLLLLLTFSLKNIFHGTLLLFK